MKHLFLFSETLNTEQCQCIALTEGNQEPILPLETRSLYDIAAFAKDCHTTLVLPQAQCGLHTLELPWVPVKKAYQAIPFALEDRLAQNIKHLHFAVDKRFHQNGQYLVLSIDETLIQEQLQCLSDQGIYPKSATSEWFALTPETALFLPGMLLIHDENFKGAIPMSLASHAEQSQIQNIYYPSSLTVPKSYASKAEELPVDAKEWIALQLCRNPYINILQGSLQPKSRDSGHQWKYWTVGGLSALLVLVFFGGMLWQWHQLSQANQRIEHKVETIYKEFFPNAARVISPRFRINRLLKDQGKVGNEAFWRIVISVGKSIRTRTGVTLASLQFKDKRARINIQAQNFDAVEAFQESLRHGGVQVKQINASNKEGAVVASLELSL